MERTLLIIKPDCFEKKCIGKILDRVENEGFTILDMWHIRLSDDDAQEFYKEHEGKEFFERLIAFMTSGPCIPVILEREDAIAHLRSIVGATDCTKAEPGTIRQLFGSPGPSNAVHASDSAASADRERAFFFGE
jgi:nucleoside-diphosphate kinase